MGKIKEITYISQAPIDGIGIGGGPRVKSIIDVLTSLGCRINLISYSFYSKDFKIEHNVSSNLLDITIIHMPTYLPRVLKFFSVIPACYYICKYSSKSEIIFSDFNNIIGSVPAILFGKIFNTYIILDCIDSKLINIVPDVFYQFIAKNADEVLCISKYLTNYLNTKYKREKSIYLPIFVDSDIFKKDYISREINRKLYCVNDNDILIGYVGSFSYYEGVPNLVQAFNNLSKKYPQIKLAIMGKVIWSNFDDNIRDLIERVHEENKIILIPPQPHKEVPKIMSAFDIACCPKIDCEINRAANPVKVVEYLSMGLPSVCSSIGGIEDIIEDGISGFLVKPGDRQDLENKIEWIIQNHDRASKIADFGRKEVIEKFSYTAFRYKLNELIQREI
ncbi:Trehalose synthase [uncultured archaeon]|nr:Trehalose synthase [uncultured archaeon]